MDQDTAPRYREVVAADGTLHAIPITTPVVVDEAGFIHPVPDAPAAPAKRALPRNLSRPIPCTLPGYEGIGFVYIVSRSKAGIAAQGGDSAAAAYLLAEIRDWPFECPAPVPGDAASFEGCEAWGIDLAVWVIRDGYQAALKGVIDPN